MLYYNFIFLCFPWFQILTKYKFLKQFFIQKFCFNKFYVFKIVEKQLLFLFQNTKHLKIENIVGFKKNNVLIEKLFLLFINKFLNSYL